MPVLSPQPILNIEHSGSVMGAGRLGLFLVLNQPRQRAVSSLRKGAIAFGGRGRLGFDRFPDQRIIVRFHITARLIDGIESKCAGLEIWEERMPDGAALVKL